MSETQKEHYRQILGEKFKETTYGRSEDTKSDEITRSLAELDEKGFIVLKNALNEREILQLRTRLEYGKKNGWYNGVNKVGNMWFDSLLNQDPETFTQLICHPSSRAHLYGLLGRQCQVRSMRGHINPGAYNQEWHLDFYGYWEEKRFSEQSKYGVTPVAVNTTFYLYDNGPELSCLKFVKKGHKKEPPHLYPLDKENFQKWCDDQEQVTIYPKAGDCVLFVSHIPHKGLKIAPESPRSNIVVHYQLCPMYQGIWHVSWPLGFANTFPFAVDNEPYYHRQEKPDYVNKDGIVM
mmetsp:Transcript_18363/g.20410  ORF Transcript_18363/g.20410 Transcript_18363/m.20410 type:complete len:293 (-) Transcript_18363:28-906(-)